MGDRKTRPYFVVGHVVRQLLAHDEPFPIVQLAFGRSHMEIFDW